MTNASVLITPDDKKELLEKIEGIIGVSRDVVKSLERNHIFEENTDAVTTMQSSLFDDDRFKDGMVQIICYGRSGYASLVEKGLKKNMSFDIIICGSESVKKFGEGVEGATDIDKISGWVRTWLGYENKGNVTIHASKIPPSIRASVFYDKNGNAQWGTMQSYQFIVAPSDDDSQKNKLYIAKPEKNLISVCDIDKCTSHDFQMMISCFNMEFKRLKDNSRKVEIVDGKVIF